MAKEDSVKKGRPLGYAPLDDSGLVPTDNLPATMPPSAHAASHKNGGGDEVAQTAAGANAIPKAGAGGTLDSGWIPDLSAIYAIAAKGVTNGDAHDHNGGDGAQIDHVNLANKGTNTHAQLDSHVASTANPHITSDANLSTSDITTNNVSDSKHGFQAKDAYALTGCQVLTVGSGTYTPTPGTRAILVEYQGAGGGGGGAAQDATHAGVGSSGAGGGYGEKFISSPAASYAYSVGAGGNGGAAGNNAGSPGGNTTFGVAFLTANGGAGGAGGDKTITGSYISGTPASGGTATGGDFNVTGGYPDRSFCLTMATYIKSAPGGNSLLGFGGYSVQNSAGANGVGYGSGGSGGAATAASSDRAGGNGTNGIIKIWELK